MRKTVLAATMVLALATCTTIAGCGNGSTANTAKQQETETTAAYIDDQAIAIIAKGYDARQDIAFSDDSETSDSYRACVNAELENDSVLRRAQFEDPKLQEVCLSYLNSLDAQIEVLDNYPVSSAEFSTKWDEAYKERTKLLKTLVNDYGLASEKYSDTLKKQVAEGSATEKRDAADTAIKELVSSTAWEKSGEEGAYTYTAVIENTTENNYKNVSLILNLYDADDVKSEAYTNANSWNKGEKVRFESYSNVDAERVEATVQYYEIV